MCTVTTQTNPTHQCLLSNDPDYNKATPNTKYVYLNLSVWANSPLNKAAYTPDLTIQFYASSWSDGKEYYATPPAADATVLGTHIDNVAGAKALVASAAAVVTVAYSLI